jgi:hypothetical protein
MQITELMPSNLPTTNPAEPEPKDDSPVPRAPASKGEQAIYDRVMLAAVDILSNPKTRDQVVSMLTQGDDLPRVMAEVTMLILLQLDEKSGKKIPGNMIAPLAEEILLRVSEIAAAVKGADQAMADEAAQIVMDQVGQAYDVDMDEMGNAINSMGDQAHQIANEQDQIRRQRAVRISGQLEEAAQQAPAQDAQEVPVEEAV